MPILNPQNEAFATFVFAFPETQITEAANKLLRNGILLGLGWLVVSIVLLLIIISSGFHGDYKTLALSVLKVASFGMTDQLTGLANRRSFDSRLGLEWRRAVQNASPISVLLINIDQFTRYNEKYGHQQGEAALKTVADALKRLVFCNIQIK